MRGETVVMWLSTCASSVETCPEKNDGHATTPAMTATARTRASLRRVRERGVAAEAGTGVAGGAFSAAAFIESVAIHVLRVTHAAREVRPRLVELI